MTGHIPAAPGSAGTAGAGYLTPRRLLRAEGVAYGCRVELRVDHAHVVTAQELDRALEMACEQARQLFDDTRDRKATR